MKTQPHQTHPEHSHDPEIAPEHNPFDPPARYQRRKDGIWVRVERTEGDVAWVWLCSPIRVLALVRGSDRKDWGKLVEIVDPDDNRHRWTLSAALFASDGAAIRSELFRLGLQLSPQPAARAQLSDLLQSWNPDARKLLTDRVGWFDDTAKSYVLGNGQVIGDQNIVFHSEAGPGMARENRPCGTLQDWTSSVAAACRENPLMILVVSLAFSGPLLDLMQIDGGGLHLRGDSSRGKSTLLRLAVSVWGSPKLAQSWRATSNGLEGVAAAGNGNLIALDEMGEVAPDVAGAAAYMLANGQGKIRASRTGHARPASRWRTAVLSSGEHSLSDKMAEAGRRPRAGQEVRLVDIQADMQRIGAFDTLHQSTSAAEFADSVTKMSAAAYGTAGPAYVAHLIADPEASKAEIRRLMTRFYEDVGRDLGPETDGQISRVVQRFALIAAAGELATSVGLTNWDSGAAMSAVRQVLKQWIAARGGLGSAEDRAAIDRTRAFIARHGDARFQRIDDGGAHRYSVSNRAGWRDGHLYYIAADVWKNEVHAGADPANSARALKANGFLVTEAGGSRLTKKVPSTPDGRPRCYCVLGAILEGQEDG